MTDYNMDEAVKELSTAVVGHKIIGIENADDGYDYGVYITLDNGKRVRMIGQSDCCAYAQVNSFWTKPENIDHIITSVQGGDDYDTWTILAAGIPVAGLDVSWSPGSGYYSYGFSIEVEPSAASRAALPRKHNALIRVTDGAIYRRSRKGWNSTSGQTFYDEFILDKGVAKIIFEGEGEDIA